MTSAADPVVPWSSARTAGAAHRRRLRAAPAVAAHPDATPTLRPRKVLETELGEQRRRKRPRTARRPCSSRPRRPRPWRTRNPEYRMRLPCPAAPPSPRSVSMKARPRFAKVHPGPGDPRDRVLFRSGPAPDQSTPSGRRPGQRGEHGGRLRRGPRASPDTCPPRTTIVSPAICQRAPGSRRRSGATPSRATGGRHSPAGASSRLAAFLDIRPERPSNDSPSIASTSDAAGRGRGEHDGERRAGFRIRRGPRRWSSPGGRQWTLHATGRSPG